MNFAHRCLLILTSKYIMNRKLLLGAALLFMTWAFNSCEGLGTCKVCRQVTYIDGSVTQESSETQYCDADLVAIENTKDIIEGNKRISWECR